MNDTSTPESCTRDHPGIAVGPRRQASLREVAEACRNRGIRQLWMLPGSLERLSLPLHAEPGRTPISHRWFDSDEPLRVAGDGWIVLVRPPTVALVVPTWDQRNPWHLAARLNPPHLIGAQVVGLAKLLGVSWHRSGALTSDNLIRHLHPGVPRTVQPPPGTPRARAGQPEGAELPLQDWRAPEGAEHKAAWCHAFDRRAQFLGAASSLALGTGEPTHAGITAADVYAAKVPGYWRLQWADGRTRWVTTPTARWELTSEAPPEIVDGWYWRQSHQYLEPWYETLRDARARLLAIYEGDERQPPVQAVKAIYREGIGRLGSVNRANPNDPLYQPYWRHAVIAEARTRLRVKLAVLKAAPVLVDVDAGYWITNTADPVTFAKRIGVQLGSGLGQWAHARTFPAAVMRDALATRNPIHALNEANKGGPQQ